MADIVENKILHIYFLINWGSSIGRALVLFIASMVG